MKVRPPGERMQPLKCPTCHAYKHLPDIEVSGMLPALSTQDTICRARDAVPDRVLAGRRSRRFGPAAAQSQFTEWSGQTFVTAGALTEATIGPFFKKSAMALPDPDTSVGHSFGLEFDGIVITAIQEVSGLKMDQDVIDLKQNTPEGKYIIKRLPGRPKAGEVTLTRAVTAETSFEQWVSATQFGQKTNARKAVTLIVFDHEGNPIKRYNLSRAALKNLEVGSLKAGDTNVLTEKLTIAYEAMKSADA